MQSSRARSSASLFLIDCREFCQFHCQRQGFLHYHINHWRRPRSRSRAPAFYGEQPIRTWSWPASNCVFCIASFFLSPRLVAALLPGRFCFSHLTCGALHTRHGPRWLVVLVLARASLRHSKVVLQVFRCLDHRLRSADALL